MPEGPSTWKRIGPVTWVPELGMREGDPWAHRKGEPRPLALLWAVYLMVASLLTIFSVRAAGAPSTAQFVVACRMTAVMVTLGVALLWPALRLSQMFPRERWRSLLADMAVLLVPVQAVLWPMMLLTHWPAEVVGALSASAASWAVLSAGVLALAYGGGGSHASRVIAMTWLLAVALGPLAMLVFWPGGPSMAPGWLGLASPLTSAYRLLDAPSGLAPSMFWAEWALVALPGAVGIGLASAASMARRTPIS